MLIWCFFAWGMAMLILQLLSIAAGYGVFGQPDGTAFILAWAIGSLGLPAWLITCALSVYRLRDVNRRVMAVQTIPSTIGVIGYALYYI
jgi:hypothetical protein